MCVVEWERKALEVEKTTKDGKWRKNKSLKE